jgi:exopolyphosphatase/pppGpp-phosphohydrolase
MNVTININSLAEIRKTGLQALKQALGAAGMVRFMQQYENGYGDYTKEKYQQPNLTAEEVNAMLKNR